MVEFHLEAAKGRGYVGLLGRCLLAGTCDQQWAKQLEDVREEVPVGGITPVSIQSHMGG